MACADWYDFDTIRCKIWSQPLICPEGAWAMTLPKGHAMQIDIGSSEFLASVVAAVAGSGLLFRKYVSLWFRGGADIERERANEALMTNFRVEIDRLSKLNNDLAERLAEMQKENAMLRDEIGQLRETISRLEHNYHQPQLDIHP